MNLRNQPWSDKHFELEGYQVCEERQIGADLKIASRMQWQLNMTFSNESKDQIILEELTLEMAMEGRRGCEFFLKLF